MVTTSALGAANSSASVPQSKAGGFSGGDFDTFLKMLTTQIRNQDPLNPMEGSDFAVQLATFSGVEQQVQTNDLLQQIASLSGANSLSTYSDWIGRQVRSTGKVHFGDSPLVMDIAPDARADRVVLVARDEYGRRVTAEEIGTGEGLVEWYGMDADGDRLPAGTYSFKLESYRGDELIDEAAVPVYSTVYELHSSDGNISFVLEGGAVATLDQIDGIAIAGS